MNARKRVYLDIPFQFDWEKYTLIELKAFRCFFGCLPLVPIPFNYITITQKVYRCKDFPECFLCDPEDLEIIYNRFIECYDHTNRN